MSSHATINSFSLAKDDDCSLSKKFYSPGKAKSSVRCAQVFCNTLNQQSLMRVTQIDAAVLVFKKRLTRQFEVGRDVAYNNQTA
jgi:hypothetical protein